MNWLAPLVSKKDRRKQFSTKITLSLFSLSPTGFGVVRKR
jgi:hypothetical protein